ncbi:MAG: hypothetical protein KGJ86_03625 [Chloroflexota bacterium]|nr:hypothetical protein [Chloroflexota bacterium]
MSNGTHTQHEDDPWTVDIGDHPTRADSPIYVKARRLMVEIAKALGVPSYGANPWQDHHSGVLWIYDGSTWRMFQNTAGIEWSAQFCADPAKVELLRQNALALYKAFPETLDKFDKLGFPEMRQILEKAVTTADDVAAWTDSIFNASMPLPQAVHTGTISRGADGSKAVAGIHHYPKPVWDQQFFKHDDFTLWVADEEGNPAAVDPVGRRGSGDGRVQVVYSQPGSKLNQAHRASEAAGRPHVLSEDHPMAKQAFIQQS